MDIHEMRRKAEAGSCVNQCGLGLRYLYGIDVGVDYMEAFRLLSLAADQGSSRAILNLAHMHARGLGIPADMPKAIQLFEAVGKPSDSSDAFLARIELGRIYSRGVDVPVHVAKALKWYSAAMDLSLGLEDSEELQEARAYCAQARGCS